MFIVYNRNKEKIGLIENVKDPVMTKNIKGDKKLSFSLFLGDPQNELLEEEGYIETDKDLFVIKSTASQKTVIRYSCFMNVEDLEGKPLPSLKTTAVTVGATVRLAIAGTGWTVEDSKAPTKKRSCDFKDLNAYTGTLKIIEKFKCELEFNTKEKKIIIKETIGEDKGVYFINDLNLKVINVDSDSMNFYNRIIPIGKDGLTITKVNNNKDYIEDLSYSTKIKTYRWVDERYTVAENLLEDAKLKLKEMCRPLKVYSVEVADLAKITTEYAFLSYNIGDVITLISKDKQVREQQRIVETTEYLNAPERNTCRIANKYKSFTDLQQEAEETKDILDGVTNDNGNINGSKVDGLEDNLILKEMHVDTLNAAKIYAGEIVANKATIDDLKATNAEITNLKANKADITDLNATNATIGVLDADIANIKTLVNGNLSSENIQAGGITSDRLTIETGFIKDAMIQDLKASKITAGQIDTSQITLEGSNGRMRLADNTIQFKDKNEKVRIQIGEDAKKDFTFSLFDETGAGVLIDSKGIKEGALSEGIIKTDHIGEGAVAGNKIDWSSFSDEFNKDTNTATLKSTKILLDDKGQTLKVGFSELKTQADDTKTKTESNTTTLNVQQGQINTAITNTTIIKNGKEILLKDDYNTTVSTVNSHTKTIGEHTTKINDATGKITDVETKTNKVEQDLNGTMSTVSSHSTKITGLEKTTSAHETKITQNTNSISLKASKTEVAEAVKDVKIGGENVFNYTSLDATVNEFFDTKDKKAWYKTPAMTATIVNYSHANNKPEDNFIKGKKILNLNYTVTESLTTGVINPWGSNGAEYIELKPNTEYTLSGYLYTGGGSTGDLKWLIWGYNDDGSNRQSFKSTAVEPKWTGKFHRFEHTFKTDTRKNYQVRFYMYAKEGATTGNVACFLYQMKLEEGNKATAWTPSSKDIEENTDKKITSAKAEIKVTTDGIAANVSKIEGSYAKKSDLKLTEDQLSLKLNSVGAGNLILNSTGDYETEFWRTTAGSTVSAYKSAAKAVMGNAFSFKSTATSVKCMYSNKYTLKPDTKYTMKLLYNQSADTSLGFQVWAMTNNTEKAENDDTYDNAINIVNDTSNITSGWKEKTVTFTTGSEVKQGFIRIDNKGTIKAGTSNNVNTAQMILVEGLTCTNWTPHNQELYSTDLKIHPKGLKFNFKDGTTTELGQDGFKWHKAGETFPYHALFYTTVTNVRSNDFLTDGKGGYNWKVTLPSYFKGKVFTPMCMIQGFSSDANKSYVMMTCGIDWNTVSYANGTYTVNCKSLNTAGSSTDYNINVVTFAIA